CGGLLEGEVCFFFFERKRGHRSWVSDGISGVCFSVRSRPARAGEILVEVLEIAPPAYTEARLVSIDLTQIQPAEYRADVVVLLLLDGDHPVRVIIVEVQLDKDPRKRFTWPVYLVLSRALHGCPADLLIVPPHPARAIIAEVQLAQAPRKRFPWPVSLVLSRAPHGCPAALLTVAPDPAVAAWCAEPIEIGVPGFILRPPVLRRSDIPIVTDPA